MSERRDRRGVLTARGGGAARRILVASLVLLAAAAAGLVVLAARGGRDAGYAVVPLAPAPPPAERELRQRLDDLAREVGEVSAAVAAPPPAGPSVSSSGESATPAAGETPRAATTAPDLSAVPAAPAPGSAAAGGGATIAPEPPARGPDAPPTPATFGTPPPADRAPPAALSAGDPDATPPDAADGAPRQPGELVSPAEAARAGSAAYRAGDYATAERLWRPLAEAGVARAEYQLGAMYYEGRLGPPDLVAAYGWVGRAAAQGYPPASELLARIAGGMTPRQLEEARRRAGDAPRSDGPPPG